MDFPHRGPKLEPELVAAIIGSYVLALLMISEVARYPILGAARITAIMVGMVFVYYVARGYAETASKALFYLGVGFTLITTSPLLQGILLEFELASVFESMYISTLLMAFGMVSVLYSFICRDAFI